MIFIRKVNVLILVLMDNHNTLETVKSYVAQGCLNPCSNG